uniref:Uncharacterized protein n=1 Tax=Arundo donax TaxID=35708 RepID=A0A0A8YCI6_ARUDO
MPIFKLMEASIFLAVESNVIYLGNYRS